MEGRIIKSVGWDEREWVLVEKDTDLPIEAGTVHKDHRGHHLTIDDGTAPQTEASSGRVHTSEGSYYPSIVNAKWRHLQ